MARSTNRPSLRLAVVLVGLACVADLPARRATSLAQDAVAGSPPSRHAAWGFDLSGMDHTVRPGDDFYRYVNGAWDARTTIPPGRPTVGSLFMKQDIVQPRVQAIVREWTEGEPPAPGTDAAKLRDLYLSYLDEDALRRGVERLQASLASVRAASSKEAMAAVMGSISSRREASFFSALPEEHQADPQRVVLGLWPQGQSDYNHAIYLRPDFQRRREALATYMERLLALVEWPEAARLAREVLALETAVAAHYAAHAGDRDPATLYRVVEWSEVEATAPGFPWRDWCAGAKVCAEPAIALSSPSGLYQGLAEAYQQAPLETLRAWVAFRLAAKVAPYLPQAFADAEFDYRSARIGVQVQRPRAERAAEFASGCLGDAIGREYIRRHYSPHITADVLDMFEHIKAAMQERVERLDWLSPATKREALAKLAKVRAYVGHPEQWTDYASLRIEPGDLLGNVERIWAFEVEEHVRRLGAHNLERSWPVSPLSSRAIHMPLRNAMYFPAAALLPPGYDADADAAIRFGSLGTGIAHELAHGFDESGRRYDAAGRLRDWWTAEDSARFEARVAALGRQYGSYEFPSLPGMRLDANNGQGEWIADLAAMPLALDAYQRSLQGRAAPVLDGYTGVQRVFLGMAQGFRHKYRDEALKNLITRGPHPPSFMRVNSMARNTDEWYEAFGVVPGDGLYLPPAERIRIW